jgi:aminodeoxyfutalosine deaminase
MITLYTADWILPVGSPPIKEGALAVEGAKILDVGPRDEVLSRLNEEHKEYNLSALESAAILPGLVNVHSHLELTIMRNYLEGLNFRDWIITLVTSRSKLNFDHLRASAVMGACEAARAGITTLADTGATGAAIEGYLEVGLRGIVFQEVFGPDPNQAGSSLDELRRQVEILRARSGPLVQVGVSPHAPYTVSANLFAETARYALSEHLPVAIHAAESNIGVEIIRRGII